MRGLLLFLLLYPFLEIAGLVMLADRIGGGPTLLWLLFTGVLGLAMLRNQRVGTLLTLGAMFRQGERVSLYSLLWPVRYLLAGLLFLIPGVISDVLAVLLLLPLAGPKLRPPGPGGPSAPEGVIEGEYTRVDDTQDPNRRLH
ncbi:FxsA family protein [Gulbenkiania mobilis]|uniref:UPF0716 protein FxsA n=1 Tax=Gulbenkiania mobilis TaxID=397457 RepID=A0ABY2CZ59_GULMO|nr:FxsA family protein [Gulbenkiania mobilis]TCW32754.1 UPF0716 protein FxsA [Gulbenkiania mobilis]